MEKFVELSSKAKSGQDKDKVWFNKCAAKRIPYITVTTRTKLADVHWDYITYPSALDAALGELRDSTKQGAMEIFERYANSRSRFAISGTLVWFYDLEIADARLAAEEFYDFMSAQLQEPLAAICLA